MSRDGQKVDDCCHNGIRVDEGESQSNRKNMTEAESVFWSLVKGGSLGQRCLRQHIIGGYIVDFLFRKSKVVIEIDRGNHFTEEQQKYDVIRTDWPEHQGYKVVCLTNEKKFFVIQIT